MEPQENTTETKKINKSIISVPAAIISGAVIIALAVMIVGINKKKDTLTPQQNPQINQQDTTPTSVPESIVKVRTTDYIKGNKNAEVIIFEYTDSDCIFCQKFHPTLNQIVKDYNGKVAWVYRPFPLTQLHPNAGNEAQALMCVGKLAGNDKFWDYLDIIINITLNPDPKSNSALYTYAENLGVKDADIKNCMLDKDITAQITASASEAQQIGAQGTPFSIAVNMKSGKQIIIPGAYPIDSVKQDIDNLLK